MNTAGGRCSAGVAGWPMFPHPVFRGTAYVGATCVVPKLSARLRPIFDAYAKTR